MCDIRAENNYAFTSPLNANSKLTGIPPFGMVRLWRRWAAHAALIVLAALAGLAIWRVTGSMPRRWPGQARARLAANYGDRPVLRWTDSYKDGTPDFLRLSDPADQAAFRRWFTLIAEYQAIRPKAEVPADITDCASLLRYAYREALTAHTAGWFEDTGIQVMASPGEIRAWQYPNTPLGANLFRVRPGPFVPSDVKDGAFAQFADAKTLVARNAYFVSRDVRMALPGDLLFYRQFGQSSPWHSMIVMTNWPEARVAYDTGPDQGHPGELRRVTMAELLDHPEPQWRPVLENPNFLGVYRWNILRGTE